MDGETHDNEAATQEELLAWVNQVTSGRVCDVREIAGGNRCRSWALRVEGAEPAALYLRYQPPRPPSAEPYTVWREAEIYRALTASAVPAPRLLAVHKTHQAILTELVPGRADYRRLTDRAEKTAIAEDFIAALVTLHGLPIHGTSVPGAAEAVSIASCVGAELAIWRAMYEETGARDPLIDLALQFLTENMPTPAGPPVLVHGDAGPGNFLFEAGRMTALLDWELAHAGDPMEDLAWFSMRAVMEPVPDFAALIRLYGMLSGRQPDLARIRYHRVFVSTRVVIIRHRNVTGQPGNSIVSRALNRRLLVTALAEAAGLTLPAIAPLTTDPTPQTALFDHVIDSLRDDIAAVAASSVAQAAKNSAKVLKYLREVDRQGPEMARQDAAELHELGVTDGLAGLLARHNEGQISFARVLHIFAASVARDSALAAEASGGLSRRSFPDLESSP